MWLLLGLPLTMDPTLPRLLSIWPVFPSLDEVMGSLCHGHPRSLPQTQKYSLLKYYLDSRSKQLFNLENL